ncbi:hypothetical protein AB0E64_31220 [Streptomyces caelestis]|uniref:Uncharacterized protein n=1 Tax=Streptomyces caelestis TaxID=36816 RepID=A0A7W9GYK5_9ACTN|nr:hypothetical protein [Streptomyces caelestis]MBB5792181.1 hypothetical protein [Streptomyces caelestis]
MSEDRMGGADAAGDRGAPAGLAPRPGPLYAAVGGHGARPASPAGGIGGEVDVGLHRPRVVLHALYEPRVGYPARCDSGGDSPAPALGRVKTPPQRGPQGRTA